MMTGLAYALILMGCSDDMSQCREVATDTRFSATLRECEKAQPDALRSETAMEIDYPVVATKCVAGRYRFAKTGTSSVGR